MTKPNTIYLLYTSTNQGNHLIGRCTEADVRQYKGNRDINILRTTSEDVEAVEATFKDLQYRTRENARTVKTIQKQTTAFSYEQVPDKMIDKIKSEYEAENHDQLEAWVYEYEITTSCGTCNRNSRVMSIWRYFFEVYLNDKPEPHERVAG